jgi:hypothetical protein
VLDTAQVQPGSLVLIVTLMVSPAPFTLEFIGLTSNVQASAWVTLNGRPAIVKVVERVGPVDALASY